MRFKMLIVLMVLSCLWGGCYQQVDQRVNLSPEIRHDPLGTNVIVGPIADAFSALVGEGVCLSDVKTCVNKDGLTEVQVDGYNKSSRKMCFEYKVRWFDANGFEVDSITDNWMPVSAMPKSSFTIKAISPSKCAVDFKIDTRK